MHSTARPRYGPYGGIDEYGTIFRWDGRFTTLHGFVLEDGIYPSGISQGIDGALYGTTRYGGSGDWWNGTIFRWDGSLTPLYSFVDPNFAVPGVVQGSDGGIYGIAAYAGSFSQGEIFELEGGNLVAVHEFNGADGAYPGHLVRERDGALYGTTSSGGPDGYGTLFRWDGSLTVIHAFNYEDGAGSSTPNLEADGVLYGTAGSGGPYLEGGIFRVLLPPATKNQCRNAGWQSRARSNGTLFKSQGDCIQYVNTGK